MPTKNEKEITENTESCKTTDAADPIPQVPAILDEIIIEELAVDGICGIY